MVRIIGIGSSRFGFLSLEEGGWVVWGVVFSISFNCFVKGVFRFSGYLRGIF